MKTTRVEEVLEFIAALPSPDMFGGVTRPAPILTIPNVFEPDLCHRLISLYDEHGGGESGVHRGGAPVLDNNFKRRRDYVLTDPDLIKGLKWRIARRLLPDVEKLFFMKYEYVERHIVGCYSAEGRGHFAPHTDNGGG